MGMMRNNNNSETVAKPDFLGPSQFALLGHFQNVAGKVTRTAHTMAIGESVRE